MMSFMVLLSRTLLSKILAVGSLDLAKFQTITLVGALGEEADYYGLQLLLLRPQNHLP